MGYLSTITSNVQTQLNALVQPPGKIIMSVSTTAPTGYLLCNGQAVAVAAYGALYAVILNTYKTTADGITQFNVPNFAGAFLRGSGGTGTHISAALGTAQADQILAHTHICSSQSFISGVGSDNLGQVASSIINKSVLNSYTAGTTPAVTGAVSTSFLPGTETRPYNFSVNYYIKT